MFYKFAAFKGPRSFTWKDPDTGRDFRESSKELLMERIREYRSGNNLEKLEHLSFLLENYWCGLPENQNSCEPVELKRGMLGYLKGGIALISNVLHKNFASQEEAERRASICVGCEFNVFPDKEGFIKWSDNLAYHSNADRTTSKDDELGNCLICSCLNKVKVYHGGKNFGVEHLQDKFPIHCWQRKDGPNY